VDAFTHYTIDTKVSQFTVQAFASGLISAVAHSPKIAIREWVGEVQFVPETLENASFHAKVKTGSLEALDNLAESDRRELHRVMNQDVLESTKFPEITYTSSEISTVKAREDVFKVLMSGDLTLHGVTNPQSIVAQVAFGVDSFRAYGEFTLLQSDYRVKIASIAGGSLKLRDELKFSFYVVARRPQAKTAAAQ
jgi:polyisoprenoid-binding protein YceI